MIAVAAAGRIFLRRAPTDMRKSFDPVGIVRGEFGLSRSQETCSCS